MGGMSYAVKEIVLTLQGEGAHCGRRAVLCRFAGCNLWSGLERDRATAVCRFCDTDFVGTDGVNGGAYEAAGVAAKCLELWGPDRSHRFVVLTGGEPTLHVDFLLIHALHCAGFEVAIETNGTRPVPGGVDWITVSPKAGSELVQVCGHELKLVYPQPGAEPEQFAGLDFRHFFLQPMDGPDLAANTRAAVDYCLAYPPWRISEQRHKSWGIR